MQPSKSYRVRPGVLRYQFSNDLAPLGLKRVFAVPWLEAVRMKEALDDNRQRGEWGRYLSRACHVFMRRHESVQIGDAQKANTQASRQPAGLVPIETGHIEDLRGVAHRPRQQKTHYQLSRGFPLVERIVSFRALLLHVCGRQQHL